MEPKGAEPAPENHDGGTANDAQPHAAHGNADAPRTEQLVDNEDVEDPGCRVARIRRTMPCLRPRSTPDVQEIATTQMTRSACSVAPAGCRMCGVARLPRPTDRHGRSRRAPTTGTGHHQRTIMIVPKTMARPLLDGRQLRKRRARRDGPALAPRSGAERALWGRRSQTPSLSGRSPGASSS